jgi:hypothetical protein
MNKTFSFKFEKDKMRYPYTSAVCQACPESLINDEDYVKRMHYGETGTIVEVVEDREHYWVEKKE